jgi:hypothetical protein
MLNKKQIDQLFLEKLKDYEKDPPVSLWNNIEKQINRGNGNISYLTFIAVAAAVLTLFLSGWWLSDTDHSNQYLSQSNDLKRDAPVEKQIKVGSSKEFKPSVFSMGTFAPTNSFTAKKESHKSAGDEPVSLDLESKIISRINSDERLLKQITNLISPVDLVPVNYKKDRGSDETDTPDPKENERKWNLKIQGGPVFTGGIKDASGLRTHPENTFSGGITVGYAVTKKLSVESGMIFNQIKQRNEIVDQAYSNPIITPSGKVSANEWSNSNAIKPVLKQELSYISVPVLATASAILDDAFDSDDTHAVEAKAATAIVLAAGHECEQQKDDPEGHQDSENTGKNWPPLSLLNVHGSRPCIGRRWRAVGARGGIGPMRRRRRGWRHRRRGWWRGRRWSRLCWLYRFSL